MHPTLIPTNYSLSLLPARSPVHPFASPERVAVIHPLLFIRSRLSLLLQLFFFSIFLYLFSVFVSSLLAPVSVTRSSVRYPRKRSPISIRFCSSIHPLMFNSFFFFFILYFQALLSLLRPDTRSSVRQGGAASTHPLHFHTRSLLVF